MFPVPRTTVESSEVDIKNTRNIEFSSKLENYFKPSENQKNRQSNFFGHCTAKEV